MQLNPRKFLGRKSSTCTKCGASNHYVNSLGGISCCACYPPRQPHHCLLRIISEAGVWTAEGEAFFVGDSPTVTGTTSPPQAENRPAPQTAATGTQTAHVSASTAESPTSQSGRVVIRRKSSEPYTPHELAWVFMPGGLFDIMDESARHRPYVIPVHGPGETLDEIAARRAKFRREPAADFVASGRRLIESNVGAVPAATTQEMWFVADDNVVPRRDEVFPAGAKCLLFPGRNVPASDPAAADIRESLAVHVKAGKRLAVIRLGGLLRLVDEDRVRVG